MAPEVRYHISNETRYFIELRKWLPDLEEDPAYQVSPPNFLAVLSSYFRFQGLHN